MKNMRSCQDLRQSRLPWTGFARLQLLSVLKLSRSGIQESVPIISSTDSKIRKLTNRTSYAISARAFMEKSCTCDICKHPADSPGASGAAWRTRRDAPNQGGVCKDYRGRGSCREAGGKNGAEAMPFSIQCPATGDSALCWQLRI